MKHLMWVALAVCVGCKKTEPPKQDQPVTKQEPPVTPDAGSPPDAYRMVKELAREATSSFARVDDAVAGKSPWITDAEAAAGIVSLVSLPDSTGKTKGTISTKRLCGDEAKRAMATYGEEAAKRSKDPAQKQIFCAYHDAEHIQWICTAFAPDDDGFSLNFDYRKVGETWTLVGVDQSGKGSDTRKQREVYDKLLTTKCK